MSKNGGDVAANYPKTVDSRCPNCGDTRPVILRHKYESPVKLCADCIRGNRDREWQAHKDRKGKR